MRNTFVRVLCEEAARHPELYVLTGDLGYGVLDKFWEKYPKQFVNVGICEQNMAGVAAGLALEGKCCFMYSIGNFPTLRCLEQIRNEIAYNKLNVNVVSVGGGFAYGALGMSHHATEDFAILRAIPHMTVFTPCDPSEAEAVAHLAISEDKPSYIRFARGTDDFIPHITTDYQIGKANQLSAGRDIIIFTAGTVAGAALEAANQLAAEGISVEVQTFLTIKPIDKMAIQKAADCFKHIVTVEEANIIGGLGGAVAEELAEYGACCKLHRLGLQDEFTEIVGSQDYLREEYGISAAKIRDRIKHILG